MTNTPPSTARQLEDRLWQLFDRGEKQQAVAAAQKLNRDFPDYSPGWRSSSQLALRLNNPVAALQAISRAVALEPANSEWLLQQASCLARLGRMREARPLAEALARQALPTAYQCSTLGLLLSRLEMQAQALQQYQRAIQLEPDRAEHYYNLATVQRFVGDFDACERNLDKAIALNPAEYEAYSLRSQLRRQTAADNHIDELASMLEQEGMDQRGEVRVCYALAKELEDIGDTQRSFSYLNRGARARRQLMRYEVEGDIQTMAAIAQHYPAELFDGSRAGCDNDEAIFVLGMPRTGSTLLERIIASHSSVYAAGELNNFAIELTRLAGKPGLSKQELVTRTTAVDFAALGRSYIDSTRPLTGPTARFIDKMPLNFLYAGLIHLALPEARIINLQRHPLDTCYAIYKTLFQDAYPFSYDLEELGRYYVAYDRLMQHWQQVMPGVIHTVRYEDLVRDTRGVSSAVLAHCGLPWEEQCLRFYESKQSSTTASASQVREPVYSSSLGRWHEYRDQLQPLITVLEQAGIHLDG